MAIDDNDLEIYGRRIPVNQPGTPDPDGPPQLEESTGFSEFEPPGPAIIPTTDAQILDLFNAADVNPVPVLDPVEVRHLSGVDLFAPEDAIIPSNIVQGPGGVLFIKPTEENPDGAGELPTIDQTETVTLGGPILNKSSGGIAPLPAVNQSVEVEEDGPVLSFSPTGHEAIDEAEVQDTGPQFSKDKGGLFNPFAIDQTTSVQIMGRVINVG